MPQTKGNAETHMQGAFIAVNVSDLCNEDADIYFLESEGGGTPGSLKINSLE